MKRIIFVEGKLFSVGFCRIQGLTPKEAEKLFPKGRSCDHEVIDNDREVVIQMEHFSVRSALQKVMNELNLTIVDHSTNPKNCDKHIWILMSDLVL